MDQPLIASAADFFNDDDYLPQSPRLEAVRPRLTVDEIEEESLFYASDTDEELDLVSPWSHILDDMQF